jgi:hypothetical protein
MPLYGLPVRFEDTTLKHGNLRSVYDPAVDATDAEVMEGVDVRALIGGVAAHMPEKKARGA